MIHVDAVWKDNVETLRGDFFHERVDLRGYATRKGVRSERRIHLVSHRLGLYGVADIVEFEGEIADGSVLPVEYKVGSPKSNDWDRLQVTAQALCLEESLGVSVPAGAIFYGETRRREPVDVSDRLRKKVAELSHKMHKLYVAGVIPEAVVTPKCRRCSLNDTCMPQTSPLDARDYWRRHEKKLVV